MYGTTYKATGKQPERRSYECHGKDRILSARETICPQRPVRGEELDAAVWAHVCELLRDRTRLLLEWQHVAKLHLDGDTQEHGELSKLETQLKRLARQEERLVDAYQADVIRLEEVSQRRQHLSERRQAILTQQHLQARIRHEALQAQRTFADLETFCLRIQTRLDEASFAEQQAILQGVIERIIVREKTLEIRHVIPLRNTQGTSGLAPPTHGLRTDSVDPTPLPARAVHGGADCGFAPFMGIPNDPLNPGQPPCDEAAPQVQRVPSG